MFDIVRVLHVINSESNTVSQTINSLKSINFLGLDLKDENINKRLILFINNLPPKTVFCFNEKKNNFLILLPFFSSHITMPIKCGENVWFYKMNKSFSDTGYSIDGYYLGRPHDFKSFEDTSYNFDTRINGINSSNVKKKESHYEFHDNFKFFNNKESIETAICNKTLREMGLKSVNSHVPKSGDFFIQGSFGNSIALTNKKVGAKEYARVELSSGNSKNFKIKEKEEDKTFKEVTETSVKNVVIREKKKPIKNIFEESNIEFSVDNNFFEEKIKTTDLLNSENLLPIDNFNSSHTDRVKDSLSSIIISEESEDFFNLNSGYFKQISNSDNLELSSNLESGENFSLLSTEIKTINTKKNNESSIFLRSNNVSIKTNNLDNNTGRISIVKSKGKDGKDSYVCINEEGDLFIDARKLIIGVSNRRENNINDGDGLVYLGHSSESQSLVLGNQLKEFLKEIIAVQKESMNRTKELFDAANKLSGEISSFSSSTNSAIASSSTIPPPAKALLASNFAKLSLEVQNFSSQVQTSKLGLQEAYSNRLQKIHDNIDKMLSKTTKSS